MTDYQQKGDVIFGNVGEYPGFTGFSLSRIAMADYPEWSEEAAERRDQIALATQVVREKRREIIRQIKRIQPEAGKNLKDVEVPQALFQLAREIVNDPEASLRFNKVEVYDLLQGDLIRRARDPAYAPGVTLDKAAPVLDGWKLASFSLFRYALNLILAPTRAEFKKIKVSCLLGLFSD